MRARTPWSGGDSDGEGGGLGGDSEGSGSEGGGCEVGGGKGGGEGQGGDLNERPSRPMKDEPPT